ncbi:MAG: (4Fe-4S)-binding protein [Chloroflexi bacterium]|nr:(4Fe-4S)-binding protein [Chloroflexota bacterium]
MKRTYTKGKLTVLWDSDKCMYAGMCHGQLHDVFDPDKRPWVNLEGADIEEIIRVIDTCPSGALSYEVSDD